MHTKAIDLKEFYESTQGRVVQRVLRQHLRHFWPDIKGLRLLGLGYAIPYLKPFMDEAERTAVLMPGRQGAVFWPSGDKGLVAMAEEGALPIETNSVDRVLAIHATQDAAGLDATLRECWRVLAGQGRLLLVVPNRTGLWARTDSTPFGLGAPWSMAQIRQALKDNMFVPERAGRALFLPPSASRLLLATAPMWEKLGHRFWPAFGGVNIVEAGKQLYAGTLAGAPVTSRRRISPAPAAIPVPERAKPC